MVGTTLNTKAPRMNVIPRLPRSMAWENQMRQYLHIEMKCAVILWIERRSADSNGNSCRDCAGG